MTVGLIFQVETINNYRRGRLGFMNKNKSVETPGFMTYSLRGAVPHLVADNLTALPIELVQLSLEHFLEQKEPSSFKYPYGIHKYLHLDNTLLFCDIRDPLQLSTVSLNTDKFISVETHGGVRQVTPELWAKAIESYRPDVVAPLSDLISDKLSIRRIKKSVDRSLRWLDDSLRVTKALDIPIFAPVMGSYDKEERKRSAELTAQRDVQGFIINVLGLEKSQLDLLIKASTDHLPSNKPRIGYGLSGPEQILDGISNGIDLFDGSYAYKVTRKGRAIQFKFDLKDKTTRHQPKTLNLWDTHYNHDFEPLDATCGCDACSRPHSKAYIHHLLTTHEMLGPVLLMSHNIYQLDQFMKSIRKSIEEGQFERYKIDFLRYYSNISDGDGLKNHQDDTDNLLGVHLKKKRIQLFEKIECK